MPHHAGLLLLLGLAVAACAGKSVDLDGSGQPRVDAGGAGGAGTTETLFTSTDGDESLIALAVDSQRLYWLAQQAGKPSALRSCLKNECKSTQLVYPTNAPDVERGARLLKVHGGTVYWLRIQNPNTSTNLRVTWVQSIWSCAATGCSEPTLLVADAGMGGFEVDSNEVYFASQSGDGLLACPISGCQGAPRTLPRWDGHEPPGLEQAFITNFPIAVGDSLFWVSKTGELVRLRKDGSSPLEPLAMGLELVTALAASESHIYWSIPLLAGSVGRCAYPACDGGAQVLASNLRRPTRLAIGGDALSFQHQLVTADWQIAGCPLADCAEPRAIAPLVAGAGFVSSDMPMAVDEAWVYVLSYAPDPPQRWRIQRIRK